MRQLPLQHAILCEVALGGHLIEQYGLGARSDCRLFVHSQNDLYRIKAGKKQFYFKVYKCGRTLAEVRSEVDLLRHLLSCELPVAVPVAGIKGQLVLALPGADGVRAGVLFQEIAGEPRGANTQIPLTVSDMRGFGALVGQLYQACDLYPRVLAREPLTFSCLVTQPLAKIRPFLSGQTALFTELQQMASQLKSSITKRLPRQLPAYGICHGDLHAGNLHFSPDHRLTLFDFDGCGYGWRAYDIAKQRRLMLWFPKKTKREQRADERCWQAFLQGYTKVRTLSAQESLAISAFIPLHHLWWLGLKVDMAAQVGDKDLTPQFFTRQIALIRKWMDAGDNL